MPLYLISLQSVIFCELNSALEHVYLWIECYTNAV